MAMVMSTADSFINSTAVLLVHDICKPLDIKITKKELHATRLASLLITIFAFGLTLTEDNLRKLMIATSSFYFPVVSMPFILSVFGFRTSTRSVLIAMGAGFSCIIVWKLLLKNPDVESALLAVFVNLVFLFGSHYLLKQPGGWMSVKGPTSLASLRQQRSRNIKDFFNKLTNFNFFTFLKKSTPNQESIYVAVSFFCIIVTYASIFTLSKDIANKYSNLIDVIYPLMLFFATALLSYPLWPNFLKNSNTIVIVWNSVIFFILICACFLFVLISNFASIQLTVFMINLILISILLRWQLALSMIIAGVIIDLQGLQYYLGENISLFTENEHQFKVGYLLLITSGILVAFLKPKQEAQELIEVRQDLFDQQMLQKNDELTRSLAIKREFINNIGHEIRTPVMGITSLGKNLYDVYNKLTPTQLDAAIKTIADSSERLESLMNNILDLSKLSSLNYKLDLNLVNLSELIYERINSCKKLYIGEKEIEFITDIESNIITNCDIYYIKSTIDNLIINAIKYSSSGNITINLHQNDKKIEFSIKDEGVGIPVAELDDIFSPFVESSRTHTTAGGRGVGLALCRKAIQLHGGEIWAESDGKIGSTFTFNFTFIPA
jgi:signal transduction histidine kinase